MALFHDEARDEVRTANAAFYAAFEARDLDAMADVWEHSDRATVTHPGWPTLRGWAKVGGSWDAIFKHTPYIQFFLTDEHVEVEGDTAWITLDENILQAGSEHPSSDDGTTLTDAKVAATNVFVRDGNGWKMIVHHGSPVGGAD